MLEHLLQLGTIRLDIEVGCFVIGWPSLFGVGSTGFPIDDDCFLSWETLLLYWMMSTPTYTIVVPGSGMRSYSLQRARVREILQ
jgi:hypothetical protein